MSSNDIIGLLEIIGFFIVWFGVGIGISFPFTALIKKFPKLFKILNLPITLYPYGYMISIAVMLIFDSEDAGLIPFIVFLVLHPLVWAALIANFRSMKAVEPKSIATLNMVNKLVQIPAYIFHFIVGLFGAALSIWGIGFFLFAIIIDIISIVISGTFSLAATIELYKQKKITLALAIFAAVASYIYCIDVVAVIIVKVIASKADKEKSLSL